MSTLKNKYNRVAEDKQQLQEFVDKVCDGEIGDGSKDNRLPDTTFDDDGKVLGVVGGAYDLVNLRTFNTFSTSWTTNGTIAQFCANVDADDNAVEGMAYLGELYCSDLPTGLANVDTVVEIMSGTGTSGKVIHLICTCGNVSPYRWEYTYWNSGANVSGWIGFQPELPTKINDRYLHTNASTGALEWSEVSAGTQVVEISANSGILTDEQFNLLMSDNVIVYHDERYYYKYYSADGVNEVLYRTSTLSADQSGDNLIYLNAYELVFYKGNKGFGFRQEHIQGTAIDKVSANPTLAGTETELLGLQIGNVKRKIFPTKVNDRYLHTNSSTGDLEWSEVSAGTQVVVLHGSSGTLSDGDYAILSGDNGIIKIGEDYYEKTKVDETYIYYNIREITKQDENRTVSLSQTRIRITKSSKAFSIISAFNATLSKQVFFNPTLSGNEAELRGIKVGEGNALKVPPLSQTDGIKCAYATPADFTIADSYSSYNRCGNILTFVLSFSITKNNATTSSTNVATFSSIPANIFTKLVPTTVGANDYLDQGVLNAFSDTYSNVAVPVALTKGVNSDITIAIDPTNLVVGTTYHLRYFVSFLMTDNLTKIDPILDNNSWADIRAVCEAGEAGDYWNVGDTKSDLGTDGNTRVFRIAHIS